MSLRSIQLLIVHPRILPDTKANAATYAIEQSTTFCVGPKWILLAQEVKTEQALSLSMCSWVQSLVLAAR